MCSDQSGWLAMPPFLLHIQYTAEYAGLVGYNNLKSITATFTLIMRKCMPWSCSVGMPLYRRVGHYGSKSAMDQSQAYARGANVNIITREALRNVSAWGRLPPGCVPGMLASGGPRSSAFALATPFLILQPPQNMRQFLFCKVSLVATTEVPSQERNALKSHAC